MARLTKEERKVFDPSLLIQNQKWKSDTIKELMIGTNVNQPGESSPYKPFDKNHPEHPDYEPPKTQEQYDQLTLPIDLATSASDVGQQVLQQRAEESKAGKINRGSRSYIGEDHQRAREIDGEVLWYDEYKHMPFYQDILKKHGHTEELQQIQNQIQQKQSLMINDKNIAGLPYQDGRAPTHMFYNRPFGYPSNLPFIKTQDMKDEAYKMFLINTKKV